MKVWYHAIGANQFGPFTYAEMEQLAFNGKLNPSDLIWKEGFPDWIASSEVKGLFAAGLPPD